MKLWTRWYLCSMRELFRVCGLYSQSTCHQWKLHCTWKMYLYSVAVSLESICDKIIVVAMDKVSVSLFSSIIVIEYPEVFRTIILPRDLTWNSWDLHISGFCCSESQDIIYYPPTSALHVAYVIIQQCLRTSIFNLLEDSNRVLGLYIACNIF